MSAEARRPEIVVDLGAIGHNVGILRDLVAPDDADVMVVVKADGYGHGMVESAAAARRAGAPWLGVATVEEALRLRDGGDEGRVLCWLTVPGDGWAAAIERDVDVTAYSVAELDEIRAAVGQTPARVQLKVDTGLSRGGATGEQWPDVLAAARAGEEDGSWRVTGIWSHLACSDEPDHPANAAQERAFREALAAAEAAGLRPEVRHLANSAGAILRPSSRFDLVRCGIAAYGLDPAPGTSPDLGLVPAMTVRAPLALTKDLHAGASVSYGHTWTAPGDTRVGLVPLGYGDGVPRHASSSAEVWIGGKRCPIRGRICMDQFVVDLGDRGGPASAGDEVVLFGPGMSGEPTADDWARACGTIHYEIVTRMGGRLHRRYVEAAGAPGSHRVSTSRKVLSVAGGLAAGAVGVAAAGTAYRVAKRRQVISRRGIGDETPFGSLHAPAITVVTDDGVDLHVEVDEYAAPRRTRAEPELTVVFVHGYSLTLDSWHFQRAAYRGRVRMVFYDQRSHGRSGRSTPGHATIEQLGRDLETVLDIVVPHGPVVLVGHSMGGMTIVALAQDRPDLFGDRVVGVGLISTTAGGLEPSRMLVPGLPANLGGQLAERLVSVLGRRHRTIDGLRRIGHSVALVATDGLAFGDGVPVSYVEFVDRMLSATSFEVVAEFFPTFSALDKFEAVEALSVVPTSIICGTGDKLTPISHSRKLHARIAGSWLLECEGAGHMVIMERHEDVDAELDRLLAAAGERADGR